MERQREEHARKKHIQAEIAERTRQAREAAYNMIQMRAEVQKLQKAADQNGDAMSVKVGKPPIKKNRCRVHPDSEYECADPTCDGCVVILFSRPTKKALWASATLRTRDGW